MGRLDSRRPAPGVRRIRVAFRDPAALREGLSLAQEASWVDGCTADLERRVLEVRAVGSAGALGALRDRVAGLERR